MATDPLSPTSQFNSPPLTTELVLAVNELFHDLEGRSYHARHPEIVQKEVDRWRRLCRMIFEESQTSRQPLRILDVGSGTGFVPLQMKDHLRDNDLLVCSDLSAAMLDACRENLAAADLRCRIEYLKLDGGPIQLTGQVFHVITLNSVLHHVPDPVALLANLDQLLIGGGQLVVAHEPNRRFDRNRLLRGLYRALSTARRLRRRKREPADRADEYAPLLAELNRQLVARGLIRQPLTMDQLWSLTDCHDPAASGHTRADAGFDPWQIAAQLPGGYVLEHVETYRHLSGLSDRGRVTRAMAWLLCRLFPRDGATFSCVLRKPRDQSSMS